MQIPPIRYAWRGDTSLAYQVVGDGPLDIVYVQGYLSNIELNWEHPGAARFLRELASGHRLIITDRRGLGLSERFTPTDTPPTEVLTDDVAAVLDAAGSERPVIFATGDCGWMALLYAATYPAQVSGLVLYGTAATWRWTEDTPWGATDEQLLSASAWVRDHLGDGRWMAKANPSIANNDREFAWGARFERLSLTPGSVYTESLRFAQADVRSILSFIQIPVLVLHRTDDPEVDIRDGRFLASRIRTAEFVELPGVDHFPWLGDLEAVLVEVKRFVDAVGSEATFFNRVLSTVLFTDIVDSTRKAAELGDAAWAELLEAHDGAVRSLIARYHGREKNTTGDGFLAMFDSPARAIRCAQDCIAAVRQIGLEIRAGCHTGEVQLSDDGVLGLTVHTAARIAARAGPGEVLVSSTVRDLSAGGDLTFEEHGVHELKGVPGTWLLFSVVSQP